MGYTVLPYIGTIFERWTNALDSMLGMMLNSLTKSATKSVNRNETKSVHRSESVCDEESEMNDEGSDEEM
jgi:hypothetical protein